MGVGVVNEARCSRLRKVLAEELKRTAHVDHESAEQSRLKGNRYKFNTPERDSE